VRSSAACIHLERLPVSTEELRITQLRSALCASQGPGPDRRDDAADPSVSNAGKTLT